MSWSQHRRQRTAIMAGNVVQGSKPAACIMQQPQTLQHRRLPAPFGQTSPARTLALERRFPLASRHSPACQAAAADVQEAPAASASAFKDFDVAETILLQGFGWDACEKGGWWNIVKEKIPEIQSSGVTHVWLPPPSVSVAPQGYLPSQLYNLDSKYGNKEELIALNQALKEAGLQPVADIVINHRCADAQDEDGIWNNFKDDIEHPGKSLAWGPWAITNNDPEFNGRGAEDSGDDYGPAPDIDHKNEEVRASLKDWLSWLRDELGFLGWRFDFTKGFAAEFIREYVRDTGFDKSFNVGEYWTDLNWGGEGLEYDQNGPRQILVDYTHGCDKVCNSFDFPTKGILQEAVKNTEYWRLIDHEGKPPGFLGWWPSKAVTFIDNHDTGSTQQHWPFPEHRTMVGYAYLLTHPGMPTIFWDHLFQHSQPIKDLIAFRKHNKLHSRSTISIKLAEADIYVAEIDERVIVKLGPRYDMGDLEPNEEEGWKKALKGEDWAVWEKN